MNRFDITLFPEKARTEDLFLEDSLETVRRVAEAYNLEARRAANKKWIETESIRIQKDSIRFVLASELWLNFPTKAIKGYIAMLAKEEPYTSLITPSGRLFRGESEFLEEKPAEQQALSDEEALIETIKLFYRPTQENQQKIAAIKKILGGN